MTWAGTFNKVLSKVSGGGEVLGAMVVLGIVFIFIVPLPTWLIDILIAVNICISCLLIVLAFYLPNPLAFSSFPSMLLLTTMFRLALSIATTRLILLEQDAGDIVEAFGNFVVGGNLAVGLVIFLIITLVNFLVITKGSERVAEVAARFSLDAMPGKQMSIDSDLRGGLIDGKQARYKREQLSRESQLFGAMDGAMKFVKGDAVAGLIIVVINILGGFSTGMIQHGMSAGDAITLYSVLTIGDGLIAQIPALLIALTAGMIITRVAPDDDSERANIGTQIGQQITSEPKSWMIASAGMLAFAALPGMPTLVFIFIALNTFALGFYLWFRGTKGESVESASVPQTTPELNGDEDLRSFTPTRPYVLQFSALQQDDQRALQLIHSIRQARNSIVTAIGLTLPPFEIEYSASLADDEFRFCVHEVPMIKATFSPLIALMRSRYLDQCPEAPRGSEERDEQEWLWLQPQDPFLAGEEIEPFTAHDLIVVRMQRAMMISGPQFLGIQECKSILSWLEQSQPELVQELQRIMPLSRFSAVLQRLASEGVPLRAVRLIIEALNEYGQHERGRELREFLDHELDDELRSKAVLVCATSDRSSMERARAAFTATALAEGFRRKGQRVLLLIDSLTRFARAQREIGLAAGEPLGRGGLPPSVYSLLPRLVERAGLTQQGVITAIYTVLIEQDSMNDPVADEVRSLLDGHIVLSRKLAERGHYPAIDVLASLSRILSNVAEPGHVQNMTALRRLLSAHQQIELMLKLGEYQAGNDALTDMAVESRHQVDAFLRQDLREPTPFLATLDQLSELTAYVPS